MKHGLVAAFVTLMMLLAAVPVVATLAATPTAVGISTTPSGIHAFQDSSPFVFTSDCASMVTVTAGDTLIVGSYRNYAPSDSLSNSWNIVQAGPTANSMWLWNATVATSGTDTLSCVYNGWAVEVVDGQTLASGVDMGAGGGYTSANPSALVQDAVALFGDEDYEQCDTSGGTAWAVYDCVVSGASISGYSQNVSSGVSPELSLNGTMYASSLTWLEIPAQVSDVYPTAPTDLAATPASTTSIALTWDNPVGESLTDTLVNQSLGVGCTSPTPIDLEGVYSAYTATGLAPATAFSFNVAVSNATGFGPTSACVSAETGSVPPAPTAVMTSTVSTTAFDVAWTQSAGTGLVNNTVYLYADYNCGGALVGGSGYSTSGAATSYAFTGLDERGYSVDVTAWNLTGESADSTCVKGQTTWVGPTIPVTTPLASNNSEAFGGSGCPTSATNSTTLHTTLGDTVVVAEASFLSLLGSITIGDTEGNTWSADINGVNGVTGTPPFLVSTLAWTTVAAATGTDTVSLTWSGTQICGAGVFAADVGHTVLETGANATRDPSATGSTLRLLAKEPLAVNSLILIAAWFWQDSDTGATWSSENGTQISTNGTENVMTVFEDLNEYGGFVTESVYENGGNTYDAAMLLPFEFVPTVPPAPTDLMVSSITETTATATWTQSTGGGIVNNTVFLYSGGGCLSIDERLSTGSATTSYALTGLTASTAYSVKVSSWNSTGQSPLSTCVDFATAAVPVSPSLTVDGLTANTFDEVRSNGTWTNITTAYIIVTDSVDACLAASAVYGNWTWSAVHNSGIVAVTAVVDYNWNYTTGNASFFNDSTIWVGLYVVTNEAFTGMFSCQEITFSTPPPPFVGNLDWVPLIIATIIAISLFSFLYYNVVVQKRRRGDR